MVLCVFGSEFPFFVVAVVDVCMQFLSLPAGLTQAWNTCSHDKYMHLDIVGRRGEGDDDDA